ncbi:MAG: hypothetical protein V4696_03860 [Pseudomonadota bacterium]
MNNWTPPQGAFDLPVTERPGPDFPAEARVELNAALALAKRARHQPPWDRRKHGYWGVVFPQMSGWLPEEERAALVEEFMVEWNRIGLMFEGKEDD